MKTPSQSVTECASNLTRFARKNPAATVLVAVGCGLTVGLIIRAFRPHAPESRVARLLGDMRDRLDGIAAPVRREAEHLIERGSSAVSSGVEHLHDLHLERGLRKFGRRVGKFFR